MAQRIALHYFPRDSLLHRWDARCKFFGLLMVTATLLHSKMAWLTFDSGLLLSLIFLSRLPVGQFLRDFRLWGIFLFILFLFQAFSTSGPRFSTFSWIPVSKNGVTLGGFTCWRLALILGYAVLFTAVTRPRELRDTLIWLLKPVPFLPGRRIGMMASLTLRFFSMTLDLAEEVRLANRARLGDQRKNPLHKVKFLALPLLRRSFYRAEDVTLALAARGFREDIPLNLPGLPLSHFIPLIAFAGALMAMGLFD